VAHVSRPPVASRFVVHVTLRASRGVWNLRAQRTARQLLRAFGRANGRGRVRVVHWGIQPDHVHLVLEALSKEALSRGMQGLTISAAKRLNAVMERPRGQVWGDRYHSRVLKTPREVRNVLVYVLHQERRHRAKRAAEGRGGPVAPTWIDPVSSGAFFDGWRERAGPEDVEERRRFWWLGLDGVRREALPRLAADLGAHAEPRTWLLGTGWRRHGLVDVAGEREQARWAKPRRP